VDDPGKPAPVIDLHLHTTASDGRSDPAVLVSLVSVAGIRTMSVTDHDTVGAVAQSADLASTFGIAFVPGIEITAVRDRRDVHILGYFIDPASRRLREFLDGQRADRVRRVRAMADRLADLGKPVDADALLASLAPGSGHWIGRPMIAWALVRAGHVADSRQAFDELIGEGRPAYVPRQGASPSEVIAVISEAGGIASLAHPGVLGRDDLIPELAAGGLAALEAYHSDHDAQVTEHYLSLARAHGLAVSGGSDYHGDESYRNTGPGCVTLPHEHFAALAARAGHPCP
jgi:predicted metal-dependent phosphoesterase TrpH